jgi:hypothetical protein
MMKRLTTLWIGLLTLLIVGGTSGAYLWLTYRYAIAIVMGVTP